MVDFDGPAYVDDFVLPIVAPASTILDRIREARDIICGLAKEIALTLNFKGCKTECAMAPRGRGHAPGRRA